MAIADGLHNKHLNRRAIRAKNTGIGLDQMALCPYTARTEFGAPRMCGACFVYEPEETTMSRVCELTGKGPMTGNNVSHANNKTKRRFLPNLNDVSLISDTLGRTFKLRISAAALRTVDHRGGLDQFLAKAKDAELSAKALKIKKDIAKAQAAA